MIAASSDPSHRSASSSSSNSTSSFHDLDEFLLGPTDLETMPFEFGCDFASAFDDKHLEVDAPGPSHSGSSSSSSSSSLVERPRESKSARSRKRKNDLLMPMSSSSSSPFLAHPSSSSSPSSAIAPRALPTAAYDDNAPLSSSHLAPSSTGSTQIGRWTKKEHELFIEGLRLYGKSWKKISSLVVTRTLVQIRTHAQKYLQKQTKSAIKAAAAAAAASGGGAKSHRSDEGDALHVWGKPHYPQHQQQHHLPVKNTPSNLFYAIAFPENHHYHQQQQQQQHSSSSSSSSCSSSTPSSLPSSSRNKDQSTMSKLDQLLHDGESSQPQPLVNGNGSDEYYASPTGSDDDLSLWLQHRHLPMMSAASGNNNNNNSKRRRIDTSAWPIVNPMEAAMAAANSSSTRNSNSSSSFLLHQSHASSSTPSDFLPPLSAFTTTASSPFSPTFGSSWM